MNHLSAETEHSKELPSQEAEKKKKRRDFWLGLIISIVLNLALGALIYLAIILLANSNILNDPTNASIGYSLIYLLPWALNIVMIIVALVIRRPAIALGILASYALAFVLALIAGTILMIICFSQSGGI